MPTQTCTSSSRSSPCNQGESVLATDEYCIVRKEPPSEVWTTSQLFCPARGEQLESYSSSRKLELLSSLAKVFTILIALQLLVVFACNRTFQAAREFATRVQRSISSQYCTVHTGEHPYDAGTGTAVGDFRN